MRKQKGFSLIELLIVVAIILIIAAIAIPNLLRSRMAANEAGAAATIRTINTAQVTYSSTYPDTGFADTLTSLGGTGATASSTNALLIDSVLGCSAGTCPKSGYNFVVTGLGTVPRVAYVASAQPLTVNSSGTRGFCSVEDAVVRFVATGGTAVTTTAGCTAYNPLQ